MSKWTVDPRAVAVVGMSCRVPGASTPDELWKLLCDKIDATSETPSERYDVNSVYSPQPAPGKIISRRAGYVDSIADFDAQFFSMSTAEATDLDPQQRLLMMTTWEALEDAGQRPDLLAGSRTGVFVGNGRSDFLEGVFKQGLESVAAAQFNNVRSVLAARVSHFFDFRGPSVLLDTACSSSLVAVHQAVMSLRAGETPFALAAGVNLAIRPDEGVLMSQVGTMSHDGRSRFGSADADGHAPSDAVAVLALKPLAAALADGDRIRAVIAGSAIGNDGRTSDSVLNPSLEGQREVLRSAYMDAGIRPADVDYVEAHGTGSPQLDPLELTALSEVLGEGRQADHPLLVGSVKTNLGHSEAASGVVGIVKSVLCLEHGQIPPSLYAGERRSDIAWDEAPMEIPAKLRDLPELGRPAVVGVSGQGTSSLNAHVVLRQTAPSEVAAAVDGLPADAGPMARILHILQRFPLRHRLSPPPKEPTGPYLLPLSARTPEALQALAEAYLAYLGPEGPGAAYSVRDICFSAATRRQHLEHRLAVIGASHADLVAGLEASSEFDAEPELAEVAERYRSGEEINWDGLYDKDGHFVPLPTYRWQTKRFWHVEETEEPETDPATWILKRHARTSFDSNSRIADIGVDSLAKLQLIVELQKKTGIEVDPEALDKVHTVGELREWAKELQSAARNG